MDSKTKEKELRFIVDFLVKLKSLHVCPTKILGKF
jgi:hypothetical protein